MINELAFSVNTFLLAEDDCCTVGITDLKLGDKIFGPTGKILTISGLRMGEAPVYRINYNDSWYSVTGDHVLNLMCGVLGLKNPITGADMYLGQTFNISVEDYLNQNPDFRRGVYGYHSTLSFPYIDPEFPPYEFGLILSHPIYGPRAIERIGAPFLKIPYSYVHNSMEMRQLLLGGYVDGSLYTYEDGKLHLCIADKEFRDDIMFLIKSLGLTTYCTDEDALEILCKIDRSEVRVTKVVRDDSPIYYPIYIEPDGSTDTVELDVKEDGEKLVMLGDFSVVHI